MIRIAICDDNALTAQQIHAIIRETEGGFWAQAQISVFQDAKELLEADGKERFDILFLDICMPGMDGFQLAERVRQKGGKRFLIFITSQDDLVYQVFPYEPFAFIRKRTKQLVRQEIEEVLGRLRAQLVQEEILVLEGAYHVQERVRIREIRYLWSQKNYMLYMLEQNRQIRIRKTMAEASRELAEKGFLRIHKSLLVNMRFIEQIEYAEGRMEISGGEFLEIGSTYKEEIRKRYLEYLENGG